jgi:hypothetical protein
MRLLWSCADPAAERQQHTADGCAGLETEPLEEAGEPEAIAQKMLLDLGRHQRRGQQRDTASAQAAYVRQHVVKLLADRGADPQIRRT